MSFVGCPLFLSCEDIEGVSGVRVWREEKTSVWINKQKTIHFLKGGNKAIFSSEMGSFGCFFPKKKDIEKGSGFTHLYLVTPSSPSLSSYPSPLPSFPLTLGEWQVDTLLGVDEEKKLVYFTGYRDTPLECHIYVTSYACDSKGGEEKEGKREERWVKRLTPLNFTNNDVYMDPDCRFFLTNVSNFVTPPFTVLYLLNGEGGEVGVEVGGRLCLPGEKVAWRPKLGVKWKKEGEGEEGIFCEDLVSVFGGEEKGGDGGKEGVFASLLAGEGGDERRFCFEQNIRFIVPKITLFSCHCLTTGEQLYGVTITPRTPGPHPTLLWVYGGPQVQLISNTYLLHSQTRLMLLASLGFCVVLVDGVGSSHRGLQFEGHLQRSLGSVELGGYLSALGALIEKGVVDRSRMAVSGTSYGGYLTLRFLQQNPGIFQVGISRAPVTDWKGYDSAYTERYMGLPQENKKAYEFSSVLSLACLFSGATKQLMIVHGLQDENVFFTHTSSLIQELNTHNKPFDLLLFPQERHGVRSWTNFVLQESRCLNYLLGMFEK